MERAASSVTDLQNFRYKPRDPLPPRDLSTRDSLRSIPSRDVTRDSRDVTRDSLIPRDKQQQSTRDNIGLVKIKN